MAGRRIVPPAAPTLRSGGLGFAPVTAIAEVWTTTRPLPAGDVPASR